MDGRERGSGAAAAEPFGPAFDEIAELAADHRCCSGQPELTDQEAEALAVEETEAVRRARRDRFARFAR